MYESHLPLRNTNIYIKATKTYISLDFCQKWWKNIVKNVKEITKLEKTSLSDFKLHIDKGEPG